MGIHQRTENPRVVALGNLRNGDGLNRCCYFRCAAPLQLYLSRNLRFEYHFKSTNSSPIDENRKKRLRRATPKIKIKIKNWINLIPNFV